MINHYNLKFKITNSRTYQKTQKKNGGETKKEPKRKNESYKGARFSDDNRGNAATTCLIVH